MNIERVFLGWTIQACRPDEAEYLQAVVDDLKTRFANTHARAPKPKVPPYYEIEECPPVPTQTEKSWLAHHQPISGEKIPEDHPSIDSSESSQPQRMSHDKENPSSASEDKPPTPRALDTPTHSESQSGRSAGTFFEENVKADPDLTGGRTLILSLRFE